MVHLSDVIRLCVLTPLLLVSALNVPDAQQEESGYLLLSANKLKETWTQNAQKDVGSEMNMKRSLIDEVGVAMDLHNSRTFYATNITVGSALQNISVFIELYRSDILFLAEPVIAPTGRTDNRFFVSSYARKEKEEEELVEECEHLSFAEMQYKDMSNDSPYFSSSLSNTYELISTNDSFLDFYPSTVNWSRDDITIGSYKVESAIFGLIDTLECDQSDLCQLFGLNKYNITGVLGLGMPGNEAAADSYYLYENFPMRLKSSGITKSVSYSLYLDDPTASFANILFGAIDHSRYIGDLTMLPITDRLNDTSVESTLFSRPSLQVTLNSITIIDTINNVEQPIAIGAVEAIFDTTEAMSYFPTDVYNTIIGMFPWTFSKNINLNSILCSSAEGKFFSFTFQGLTINIPLSSFLASIVDFEGEVSDMCTLNIKKVSTSMPDSDSEESSMMFLGDSFMRYVYMVVDMEHAQIGLAQANFDYENSNIEIISDSVPKARSALEPQNWTSSNTVLKTYSVPASSLTKNIDNLENIPTDIVQTLTLNSVAEVSKSSVTQHSVQSGNLSSMSVSLSSTNAHISSSSFNSASSIQSQTQKASGGINDVDMSIGLFGLFAIIIF